MWINLESFVSYALNLEENLPMRIKNFDKSLLTVIHINIPLTQSKDFWSLFDDDDDGKVFHLH